jgi:hypothetical protein
MEVLPKMLPLKLSIGRRQPFTVFRRNFSASTHIPIMLGCITLNRKLRIWPTTNPVIGGMQTKYKIVNQDQSQHIAFKAAVGFHQQHATIRNYILTSILDETVVNVWQM